LKDKEDKFDKLRWVRLLSPSIIPKYLVEQLKHREFSVENFYKYNEQNCSFPSKDGIKVNPLNHIYGLLDENNVVVGFLWFVVDEFCGHIFIHNFSIDNKYWHLGKAVEIAADHVKDIMKTAKIKKAYWLTRYPKHSERYGFKRSKDILMEYKEEKVCQDQE
jgi:hypothetical protein